MLAGWIKHGIVAIAINADGTDMDLNTAYFFPIQQVNIDENPNLEQNSNWGGTFNPTME